MITHSNLSLSSFNTPPLVELVPFSPTRTKLVIGAMSLSTKWVWPNETEALIGGITIPHEPPYIVITREEYGELVQAQWFCNSSIGDTVTIWRIESFGDSPFSKESKLVIPERPIIEHRRNFRRVVSSKPRSERTDSSVASHLSLHDFLRQFRRFRCGD